MNSRNITMILLFAASALVACGATHASTTGHPSPALSNSPASSVQSPSPAASPVSVSPASTLYVLAPVAGSKVGGTVQIENASTGVRLTATVTGLRPGHRYIIDADPLPCELFVGGPSQSFPRAIKADAGGRGSVAWTVPSGMNGNVSVQVLTSQGTYAVLACADLAP